MGIDQTARPYPALPCRVVLNAQSRPLDTAMKLSIQKGWLRLGAVCGAAAGMGVGVELFMIKTGFYDIVTRREAENRLNDRLKPSEEEPDATTYNTRVTQLMREGKLEEARAVVEAHTPEAMNPFEAQPK